MHRSRRTILHIAAALAIAAAVTAAPTLATAKKAWQPEKATYGDVTATDVHITMSDGVDLVGDVVYPADKKTGNRATGNFPVLLTQNPYVCSLSQANAGGGSFFADRGYIFASIC